MEDKDQEAPYFKKLNDTIDSFGYEWELNKGQIILDLERKKLKNAQFDGLKDRIVDFAQKSVTPKLSQIAERITQAKVPAINEIIADIFFIVVFSIILWHFSFINFNPTVLLIISVIIIILFASLFKFIHYLSLSDEDYLKSRFGFKRERSTLRTDAYNIVKKIENGLVLSIFLSAVFIALAILPFFYNYPPLLFINSFLNVLALFLTIFLLLIKFIRNEVVNKDPKIANLLIIAIIGLILVFVGFVVVELTGQAFINQLIGYIIDLVVVYAIFVFIQDVGNTRRYRKWVENNWR